MRRPHKLLVTCLVVGAATALIAWNTAAEAGAPALGVADAKRRAALHESQAVAVRGSVLAESIVVQGSLVESFVIADAEEQLRVVYNQLPPDNFGPKDVVVNGVLGLGDEGEPVLYATSIQVGCSSKY